MKSTGSGLKQVIRSEYKVHRVWTAGTQGLSWKCLRPEWNHSDPYCTFLRAAKVKLWGLGPRWSPASLCSEDVSRLFSPQPVRVNSPDSAEKVIQPGAGPPVRVQHRFPGAEGAEYSRAELRGPNSVEQSLGGQTELSWAEGYELTEWARTGLRGVELGWTRLRGLSGTVEAKLGWGGRTGPSRAEGAEQGRVGPPAELVLFSFCRRTAGSQPRLPPTR